MIGAFMGRVAPFNVNYRYVADELLYLLDNSQCRALVYHAAFAPTLAEVRDRLPRLEVLIQVADDSGNDLLPGAVDYEAVVAETEPTIDVRPTSDDLYILYTGGTTGMPKGVLWRQHDIFLSAMGGRNILTQEKVETYDDVAAQAPGVPRDRSSSSSSRRSCTGPPSGWRSSPSTTATPSSCPPTPRGSTRPRPGARSRAERCTTLTVVGDAIARPLVEELESGSYDTSSLLSVGNGGAPLTPTIKARLLEQLPHIFLTDAVGLVRDRRPDEPHVERRRHHPAGASTPAPARWS